MTLLEALPVDERTVQWSLWSTIARVVVSHPTRLGAAETVVREVCGDVERACSRFRRDTEIHAVERGAGRFVAVGSVLATLIRTALDAARRTDGDVDPTIGRSLADLGYDRDLREMPMDAGPVRVVLRRSVSWRDVEVVGDAVRVPPGVELDLGATAKAWAADHAAERVAREVGVGVLVALGGDIATAGTAPEDGDWQVLVQDGADEPSDTVTLPAGTALATSSTQSRQWLRDGRVLHHIVDPATGMPVAPVFRTASVAAPTCVEANTLSTTALVRGLRGVGLLASSGRPARLVTASSEVVRINRWPGAQ